MNKSDRADMLSKIFKFFLNFIRIRVAICSETNKRYAIKIMRG